MLSLHLLQSALVHINTLFLQAVLEVPEYHDGIGPNKKQDSHRCSGPTSTPTADSNST